MTSFSLRTSKHPYKYPLNSTICFWKPHFAWKERMSQSKHETWWISTNAHVCVQAVTLTHWNEVSMCGICKKTIKQMLSNCADVLQTIRKAVWIWRPAETDPSLQNPRNAHHNHIHLSPAELQRGPKQELIPVETKKVLFFKSISSTLRDQLILNGCFLLNLH